MVKTAADLTISESLSDNRHFISQFRGFARLKFVTKLGLGYLRAQRKLSETLKRKECFYGPFKGEFGHFLAHTLPFISFLHEQGVKIHYCGMELHRPFMKDESGSEIVASFHSLRDFFAEKSPATNRIVPPDDVQAEIRSFNRTAANSGLPFWDIDDEFYYWYIQRNWLLKGPYTHAYRLDKLYAPGGKENAVTVFPRSKGAKSSKNNGDPWDYQQLCENLSKYFDKVYVCGHPSQVLALEPVGNMVFCITTDNAVITEKCSKSRLIITQHSGVTYLGEYTATQVMVIYKGGQEIGSIGNTLRFRPYIAGKGKAELFPMVFAFDEASVEDYCKKLTSR
jgi:hypothetical protein